MIEVLVDLVGHDDEAVLARQRDEPVAPGDYVLNHVGFAIRRIPAEDIEGTLAMYEELIRQAPENDLMALDVRGEISGAGERNG